MILFPPVLIFVLILIILAIVVICTFIFYKNKNVKNKDRERHPLFAVNLLTSSEATLYRVLKKILLEKELMLFAKVRWEDIFNVKNGVDINIKNKYRGRIRARHVDFLIVDKNFFPKLIVELNDRTHNLNKSKLRDGYLREYCEDAGLKLFFIKRKNIYDELLLKERILAIIENNENYFFEDN